jgi:hypothetical protein
MTVTAKMVDAAILSLHEHVPPLTCEYAAMRRALEAAEAVRPVPVLPDFGPQTFQPKCAVCNERESEHHYNGASYGKCGAFVSKHAPSAPPEPDARPLQVTADEWREYVRGPEYVGGDHSPLQWLNGILARRPGVEPVSQELAELRERYPDALLQAEHLGEQLEQAKTKLDALRKACRDLLAAAYVGDGKIVCPDAFIGPVRAIHKELLDALQDAQPEAHAARDPWAERYGYVPEPPAEPDLREQVRGLMARVERHEKALRMFCDVDSFRSRAVLLRALDDKEADHE